jgi:hypothetical protein
VGVWECGSVGVWECGSVGVWECGNVVWFGGADDGFWCCLMEVVIGQFWVLR